MKLGTSMWPKTFFIMWAPFCPIHYKSLLSLIVALKVNSTTKYGGVVKNAPRSIRPNFSQVHSYNPQAMLFPRPIYQYVALHPLRRISSRSHTDSTSVALLLMSMILVHSVKSWVALVWVRSWESLPHCFKTVSMMEVSTTLRVSCFHVGRLPTRF